MPSVGVRAGVSSRRLQSVQVHFVQSIEDLKSLPGGPVTSDENLENWLHVSAPARRFQTKLTTAHSFELLRPSAEETAALAARPRRRPPAADANSASLLLEPADEDMSLLIALGLTPREFGLIIQSWELRAVDEGRAEISADLARALAAQFVGERSKTVADHLHAHWTMRVRANEGRPLTRSVWAVHQAREFQRAALAPKKTAGQRFGGQPRLVRPRRKSSVFR